MHQTATLSPPDTAFPKQATTTNTMAARSPTLASRHCAVCLSKDTLLRCGGCQVVYYCGRDHQATHRAGHKRDCNVTRRARDVYDAEDAALRNMPATMFLPENVFETCVGHFWGIAETRDYSRQSMYLVLRANLHTGKLAVGTGLMMKITNSESTLCVCPLACSVQYRGWPRALPRACYGHVPPMP